MVSGRHFTRSAYAYAGAAILLALILGGFLFIRSFAALLPLHTNIEKYKNEDLRPAKNPSRQVMALAMQVQKMENYAPSTGARLYAYVAGIYADTLAKTGSATTSAAATVLLLEHMVPKDKAYIHGFYTDTYKSEPTVGTDAADILAAYKARTKTDGFDLTWSPDMIPAGPDYWYVRDKGVDGGAMSGQWTPWILATSSASVPPPPSRGSIADALELAKVQYAVNNRRFADLPAIYFWQGSTGFSKGLNHDNMSTGGVWQNILSAEEGSTLSDAEYARAQKILAQGIADSFIYTWQVKFKYYTQRPSMRIKGLDQAIGDPPFPSYTSGHSTISSTAVTLLSSLFPDKQAVWTANYHDARYSRLDAGIHFDADNAAGYSYGSQLGEEMLDRLGLPHVAASAGIYKPVGPIAGLFQLASFKAANYLHALHMPGFVAAIGAFIGEHVGRGISGDAAKIRFTDVAAEAGLDYLQSTSADAAHCLVPTQLNPHGYCDLSRMAGGATVGDFNNDGWPDLYVTRIGSPGILYENMRDGTFKDATDGSGIDTGAFDTNGALFADLNNDGWPDLYVTTIGSTRNLLFMNDGKGRFTEEAAALGAALDNGTVHVGQSVSAGDYDQDGYLDLFVGEWLPDEIAPASASHAALLKNKGAAAPGHFTDATSAAGINLKDLSQFGVYPISSTFADLDNDGRPDLAIAGDFGTSRLYWNKGDGTFMDGTEHAGVGTEENGMGSAIGDFNGDGLLDWFVTSIYNANPPCTGSLPECAFGSTGNRLYQNTGGRIFTDVTDPAGVRDGGWGWGAAWIDAGNSGALDLAMTNGFTPDPNLHDPAMSKLLSGFASDPMRLWHNNGDGMSDIAGHAGLTDNNITTGLVTLDFNQDGRSDILVVDNGGKPHLYRNDSNTGNSWLRVRALTAEGGRDALGAVIRVQTAANGTEQTRQAGVNSGFLGQSEAAPIFGLGAGTAPVATVTVQWPWLNKTKTYTNVARGTTLVAIPD
jgi:hypothetical protein